jgi:hypothetical protein
VKKKKKKKKKKNKKEGEKKGEKTYFKLCATPTINMSFSFSSCHC